MAARLEFRVKRQFGVPEESMLALVAMLAMRSYPQLAEVSAVLSDGTPITGKAARGRPMGSANGGRSTGPAKKAVAKKAAGQSPPAKKTAAKKRGGKKVAKKTTEKAAKKRRPLSPEARAKLAQNLVKARAARARKLKAAKRTKKR